MNQFLFGVCKAVKSTFPLPEPIVEAGSFLIPGQEDYSNLRKLFPHQEYVGIDMRPGEGVDMVGNIEDLPFENESVGTVIALNLFEHVQRFWVGFDEIYRVLRPGGALFVSCPFFLHRHAFPNDYWRMTPDAFSFLLEKYPQKLIGLQGPESKPLQVWAVAFKAPAPVITPQMHQSFQQAMQLFAHQPQSLLKKLRLKIARWICGRGPLATALDVNRWQTNVLGHTTTNNQQKTFIQSTGVGKEEDLVEKYSN